MRRPFLGRFRRIHGRTMEVHLPDSTDDSRPIGVIGYTSPVESLRLRIPAGWWFDLVETQVEEGRCGSGYPSRDAALRAMRGIG